MRMLQGLECSTIITHAHTKKLLRNALQSVLLTKLPLLTPTKHKLEPERSAELLGGKVVHVPSSCQVKMVIDFNGGFCFKDASRFATSLSSRFLVCPC